MKNLIRIFTAKKNCEKYGNNLNQIEINYKDYQNNIEDVIRILEEPLSNQGSVLNYILAKNVKKSNYYWRWW